MGYSIGAGAALQGLTGFQAQVDSIAENLANVQTVGFKRIDRQFEFLYNATTAPTSEAASVRSIPLYRNDVSGNIVVNSNPTSFFLQNSNAYVPVAAPDATTSSNGLFTRAGDFSFNQNGVLVNSAGYQLLAVPEQPAFSGTFADTSNGSGLTPVSLGGQTSSGTAGTDYRTMPAAASTIIDYNANFPASAQVVASPSASPAGPAAGQSSSDQTLSIAFFDSTGAQQTLQLTARKTTNDTWQVIAGKVAGTGGNSDTTVVDPAGPFPSIQFNSKGQLAADTSLAFSLPALPNGASAGTLTLNLGTSSTGSTQHAGNNMEIREVNDRTGHAEGTFQSAAIDKEGYVDFQYSNGLTQKAYRIPVAAFANPERLQRVTGSTFGQNDTEAGSAYWSWAGADSRGGGLIPQSAEQSNVDMGEEMTKMIQAQRAYSSNSKALSTWDQMDTTAINLK